MAGAVLLLLILSFWVSYYLKVRRIRSVHETIVAMFAGMFVGALVRLSPGHVVQSMIAFKSTILLNVLLPPIILNSGYGLRQENFFRNFAVILTFAFAGTFISAVVLGVFIYLYSLLGLEGLSLTMVECLLFGSTLSATDPVTILAIFNALHVDPKLYSIIFGESILNDAVAIVMFETLSQFHGLSLSLFSFFHGTGIFLLTFCISMALGVCFGLGCSLMLKHSELGRYTEIEACLVLLIAYTSYFFSNALTMSGIVSLLFCGITLKHYAYHNMSRRTQRTTRYLFGSLAQLSENFIFIYLGLSLFTQTQLVYKPMFILVTALAVCIARYCAVFPISKLINLVFRARGARTDEIPHSYRVMLFWAGLRGAVGVALAQGLKGEHAVTLQTTCLVAVVLTTMLFGGTIQRMIEILGIRTGMDDDEENDSSDEEGAPAGGYSLASLGDPLDLAEGARRHSKRRSEPVNAYRGGRNARYASVERGGRDRDEYDTSGTLSPHDSPYRDVPSSSRLAAHSRAASRLSAPRFGASSAPGSDLDASSEDSDRDELPPATAAGPEGYMAGVAGGMGRVWRDGQWFQVLDEKFLIPVFSNATASRKQASKKALRAKRNSFAVGEGSGGGSGGKSGDEGDASAGAGNGGGSPYLGGSGHVAGNKSFSDILSSLITSNTSTSPSASPTGAGPSIARIPPFTSAPNLPLSSTSLASPVVGSPQFASPNSPLPSMDLTAGLTTSASSRAAARSRSSGSHTPSASQSGGLASLGSGPGTPVMAFGPGRRSSVMGGGGSGSGRESPEGGSER
ncbi:monovalent cation:H+ antiporter, CPA1 (nhx1) [Rhodosporidiobolus nylandii]